MSIRICVFCGSRSGNDPIYVDACRAFARACAVEHCDLVYGGGKVGLMGELADAALEAGVHVIGVIPQALYEAEIAHLGLSELHVVADMHQRKMMMAGIADAFVALPGGTGTLEELFEQWTWAQLGLHTKPSGFLNCSGYYDPMTVMLERMMASGFLASEHREMLVVASDPLEFLRLIREARPVTPKWRSPAIKSIGVRDAAVRVGRGAAS